MYCGWQTRASRLRWAAVVFLIVACAALGIMYAVVSKDCRVCRAESRFVDPDTGEKVTFIEVCTEYDGVGDLGSANSATSVRVCRAAAHAINAARCRFLQRVAATPCFTPANTLSGIGLRTQPQSCAFAVGSS